MRPPRPAPAEAAPKLRPTRHEMRLLRANAAAAPRLAPSFFDPPFPMPQRGTHRDALRVIEEAQKYSTGRGELVTGWNGRL